MFNAATVAPIAVYANNWRQVALPSWDDFIPYEKVSIIIPYYNQPDKLPIVLKALECQTYPRELLEVIIAADFPDASLQEALLPTNIRVVRQPHRGFGVARARNMGAKYATGNILVFFDGDIVPNPYCVAAHARWHHQGSNILTIGDRSFIKNGTLDLNKIPQILYDLLNDSSNIELEASDHRDFIDLTDEFTNGGDTVFEGVIGHNFALRKDSYFNIGGQNIDSQNWGFEDTEFGYRAYQKGMIIAFVKEAHTWHLGPQDYREDAGKAAGYRLQASLMENYIANYRFRNARRGRTFAIPENIISIKSPDAMIAFGATLDILEDRPYDLIVRLDLSDNNIVDTKVIKNRLHHDSRVVFSNFHDSLQEYPYSPNHIYMYIDKLPKRKLVSRVCNFLNHCAMIEAYDNEFYIHGIKAWALHRSIACVCSLNMIGKVKTLSMKQFLSNKDDIEIDIQASSLYKAKMLLHKVRSPHDVIRIIKHRLKVSL